MKKKKKKSWILTDNILLYLCFKYKSIWHVENEISSSYLQYTEAYELYLKNEFSSQFCVNLQYKISYKSPEDWTQIIGMHTIHKLK